MKAETYEYLSNMFLTILLGSLSFLTLLVFVHGFGVVGWIPEYVTVLNLAQGVLLGSLFILPSYLLGGFFDSKARKLKEVHDNLPPFFISDSRSDGSRGNLPSSAQTSEVISTSRREHKDDFGVEESSDIFREDD